jgi:drug/metabolite transporter (DMT)-like permease
MLKDTSVSRLRVGAAFLAIYLIWGSTYLAIRFAIDTLPPLLMASFRFLIAGPLLYAWVWLKEGNVRPTGLHWKEATVVGGLLVLGGNGCVVLAEQWVPTGIASIIISLVPIWMVLADWARPGGRRPGKWVMLGLILGFAGMILLINPFEQKTLDHVNWTGAFVLLLASLSWSLGSIYSRHARSPNSPILFTAMQMTAGGIMLLVAGTLAGEWQLFHWGQITFRSLAAFKSQHGFTCFDVCVCESCRGCFLGVDIRRRNFDAQNACFRLDCHCRGYLGDFLQKCGNQNGFIRDFLVSS